MAVAVGWKDHGFDDLETIDLIQAIDSGFITQTNERIKRSRSSNGKRTKN